MLKVILFVILTQSGHQPQMLKKEAVDLADCLVELHAILESPTITINKLPNGGSLQAGCVLQAEASDPT